MSSADASQNLVPSGLDENAVNGDSAPEQPENGVIERADLLRIVLVIAVAGAVWFLPRLGWLGIAGVLIGGFPIFAEAYENLRQRRMTMELSMTLALLAALVIREYFIALIIMLFVLVEEIFEGLTALRPPLIFENRKVIMATWTRNTNNLLCFQQFNSNCFCLQ